MVRLIRFLARHRMLTPAYARLALRYARRRHKLEGLALSGPFRVGEGPIPPTF